MLASMLLAIVVALAPVTAQATASQQPAASAAQPTAETPWPPAGVYLFTPGGNVTAPRLIKSSRPDYTAEAMRAKVTGTVKLEAVVKPDGTVGEVRVVRSLDRKFGLDDSAVKSAKQYRFTPGTKDGMAVPVLVSFEVQFTLK
jgi:TonB family protein